jgi:hypothetical protein
MGSAKFHVPFTATRIIPNYTKCSGVSLVFAPQYIHPDRSFHTACLLLLYARCAPNNNEAWAGLVDATQAAWEQLTIRHLINLAETMSHRVEEVIRYEGWHTCYCCDLRVVQIKNQAEPSELIPRYLQRRSRSLATHANYLARFSRPPPNLSFSNT